MDFARCELLALLGDHDAVQCSVHADFSDIEALADADAVVAYTCDVRPTAAEVDALTAMLDSGGRLLALHATNSAIDPPSPDGPRVFQTPDVMPEFASVLGNRFLAHPKIAPYLIEVAQPQHPLVAGISGFITTDEIYVMETADDLDVLLDVAYTGPCPGFATDDAHGRHPILYTRRDGQVTYLTLGHCRGRWDVRDLGKADLGVLDRVAWESPEYREVLRRSIGWAVHGNNWQQCPTKESA